ncbi:hypothetical protein EJB05_25730 [Eragrostis curvula]|uniref:Uncharacterized protein n=1 Tax=Eragrostis curvula TaxID=38414 RepID=A0A5J9UJK5_9POAL|nr:hypothetical protein EJB05_25730 [Eragrostis curvula]
MLPMARDGRTAAKPMVGAEVEKPVVVAERAGGLRQCERNRDMDRAFRCTDRLRKRPRLSATSESPSAASLAALASSGGVGYCG